LVPLTKQDDAPSRSEAVRRLVEIGLKGCSQMKLGHGIKQWTPEEEERLRSMISERLRPHEIAVKLHRTVDAVSKRAHKLRLSFKKPPANYIQSDLPESIEHIARAELFRRSAVNMADVTGAQLNWPKYFLLGHAHRASFKSGYNLF
jgi:hypothetical protein